MKDLFDQLAEQGKFTAPLIHAFSEQYGKTFFKALEKLESAALKVEKLIFQPSQFTIWSVQGKNHPYLLYPGLYCQCKAFTMTTVYRQKKYTPCKHLLAQKIGYILGQYTTYTYSDREFTTATARFLQ